MNPNQQLLVSALIKKALDPFPDIDTAVAGSYPAGSYLEQCCWIVERAVFGGAPAMPAPCAGSACTQQVNNRFVTSCEDGSVISWCASCYAADQDKRDCI